MVTVDKVFIINLAHRKDRLETLLSKIQACSWPFPVPEIFPAYDGNVIGCPPEFTSGNGAYGCRQSHLGVLTKCLMEGVETVLVLEDDADILPDFGSKWKSFIPDVPSNWRGIMLGGEHMIVPLDIPNTSKVKLVQYTQRTHAYIARSVYQKSLHKRWGCSTVHIDWRMQDWQKTQSVYCPTNFLIGQCGGKSDISGRTDPPQWWNKNSTDYKPTYVVHLTAPRDVVTKLRVQGFHTGYWRDPVSDFDMGLIKIFGRGNNDIALQLRNWLIELEREAASWRGTVAVWHPNASIEQLIDVFTNRTVITINADSIETAMQQWMKQTNNAPVRG